MVIVDPFQLNGQRGLHVCDIEAEQTVSKLYEHVPENMICSGSYFKEPQTFGENLVSLKTAASLLSIAWPGMVQSNLTWISLQTNPPRLIQSIGSDIDIDPPGIPQCFLQVGPLHGHNATGTAPTRFVHMDEGQELSYLKEQGRKKSWTHGQFCILVWWFCFEDAKLLKIQVLGFKLEGLKKSPREHFICLVVMNTPAAGVIPKDKVGG